MPETVTISYKQTEEKQVEKSLKVIHEHRASWDGGWGDAYCEASNKSIKV